MTVQSFENNLKVAGLSRLKEAKDNEKIYIIIRQTILTYFRPDDSEERIGKIKEN